ncbi:MAG: hypothetical protein HFH41_07650 [Lachnospiraceae bacterium]|nr:hypothetical protein [Lachnospiraceae bacterium]
MKDRITHKGKYLFITSLLGFGILLFYISAAAWGSMVWMSSTVMFYLEQPISAKEALSAMEWNQKIREKGQEGEETELLLDFCIWGQEENVTIENKSLSASTQADVISLCGNPELLFENCGLPVKEDAKGCVIDEKTAWDLFGSSQVAGKEIFCEGKSYIVRKVISGKEKIIAFQARQDKKESQKKDAESGQEVPEQLEKLPFNRITLRKLENQSIYDLQSAWNNQYGLPAAILDTELLRGISGTCLLLLPFSLCIFFWVYLYHQYKIQDKWQGKAGAAGAAAILLILFLIFWKRWVQIPDDYIPTKWSNFSFWTNLWETKTEAVRLLIQIPKTNLDSVWIRSFFQTVACSFLAEVFLITGGLVFTQNIPYAVKSGTKRTGPL